MRTWVALCVVALVGANAAWETYKKDYNKHYNAAEEQHRFKCFEGNLKRIEARNALGAERHGLNDFTDMCPEEFRNHHNLRVNTSRVYNFAPEIPEAAALAAGSVDWRTKGAVTAIKNQGQCGSCWSFSATGNMEGQHFLASKQLVGLSEEELCQCSHNGNQGCNGGLMDNAFEWVKSNGGIDSESDYPYTSGGGITGTCKNDKLKKVVAKFTGHTDVQHSETQMAAWTLKNGPLSIAVDAASGWQTYSGGIMKNCNGRQLDHGVLIVGFGTSGSTDYWIVKNSWGTGWGEKGYIQLERGTNQCGLNQDPCSAIASNAPVTPMAPAAPMPPSPPSPPAPSCNNDTSFTQSSCLLEGCKLCEKHTFQANTCLKDSSGSGVEVCCGSDGQNLILKLYTDATCTGTFTTQNQPLNKCLKATNGAYIEDTCGGSSTKYDTNARVQVL